MVKLANRGDEKMFLKSLEQDYVRSFLQQLLTQDRYQKITIPENLVNLRVERKYAFFLALDAIIKFNQIIDDEQLLVDYITQLNRLFKKFTNYSDIKTGINSLLAKIVAVKLNIYNSHSYENREKILRFIYDKYIVHGYFYFGFSSNHINELTFVGLRKDGFLLDSKLEVINQILNKTMVDDLFEYHNTSITDDFTVALYEAFTSPDYITCLANKTIYKTKLNDDCFYTKDIMGLKEQLLQITKNQRLNNQDSVTIINNFIDICKQDNISNIKPCLAFIKRSAIGKNQLKDIEEIIKNDEESLEGAISLILDSRYTSFYPKEDLLPYTFTLETIPKFNDFVFGKTSFAILNEDININEEELKMADNTITSNVKVNSYGAVSFAIIGLILIMVGILISIFLQVR